MRVYNFKKKNEKEHQHSNFLSDFILGSQDGLVNVLGIILGLAAASSDIKLIFVAALAALGAESISMGAVAYTSTLARQKQYAKDVQKEEKDIEHIPGHSKKEVKKILSGWGYTGKKLEEMTNSISANPKATLEFMLSFEQNATPVDKSAPMRSFLTVLSSTILGSIIPLLPFIFTRNILIGAIAAVIISGIALFFIGYYEAKTTIGSLWKTGLKMAIIGLTAGFAGYLIGHFVGAIPI